MRGEVFSGGGVGVGGHLAGQDPPPSLPLNLPYPPPPLQESLRNEAEATQLVLVCMSCSVFVYVWEGRRVWGDLLRILGIYKEVSDK